jgi:hypothetical protein
MQLKEFLQPAAWCAHLYLRHVLQLYSSAVPLLRMLPSERMPGAKTSHQHAHKPCCWTKLNELARDDTIKSPMMLSD